MADGEPTAPTAAEPRASVDPGARYQARIALVTAIVALVSAILGPLVSLRINSSQIEEQGEQNDKQVEATAQQSESEFVRTQRSQAYADYMSAFNNSTLDLLGAAGAFASGGDAQALSQQATTSIEAVKAVTTAYYQVKVVGSSEAVQAADALYAEFGVWSGELLVIGGQVVQGNGADLTQEQQQLLLSTDDEYVTLLGLANEFVEQGRDDMSSNLDD